MGGIVLNRPKPTHLNQTHGEKKFDILDDDDDDGDNQKTTSAMMIHQILVDTFTHHEDYAFLQFKLFYCYAKNNRNIIINTCVSFYTIHI